MKRIACLLVLTLASPVWAQQAEWHHWRGPNQNGSVDVGNPPIEWSKEKNVIWSVEIPGKGSSTPIIVGDQVYVLTTQKADGEAEKVTPEAEASPSAGRDQAPSEAQRAGRPEGRGEGRGERGRSEGRGGEGRGRGRGRGEAPKEKLKFMIVSFDRTTGKRLWEKTLTEEVPHEAIHGTNTFAASSPVTDGKHLYVDYGSRGIYCLDLEGNVKWKQSLGQMKVRNSFGEGASAALAGDKLIVPWDNEENSFIAALSTSDGSIVWKTERKESSNWATPLIVEHKGRTQIVVNGKTVRSYDAKDGKLIWECGGQTGNAVPTPIHLGDKVICMTGWNGNAVYCISLDSKGDVSKGNEVAWSYEKIAPYVPTGTLYKGSLYLSKGNSNVVACLDAKTGVVITEPSRLPELEQIYSSPVSANDHIYFTGRDGTTVVFKHGPGLEVVSKNSLDETVDASLAIVGDQIFIRGEKHLFCIGKK